MKKLIAMLLALVMVFSLAACSAGGEGGGKASDDADVAGVGNSNFDLESGNTSKVDKAKLTEEKGTFKIAFSYGQFTDKLGSQFKNALEYLAANYNCEMVFFEAGSGDEGITALESVLSAGDIDGVIQVGGSAANVAAANKYKVPYVFACGFPSQEEEIKGCIGYDNFLGGVIDDDVWAGEHCIEALYDAGCRNITYSGLTQGFVKSHDDRYKAMHTVLERHPDMNLLAENYSMGLWADDIATFNASFSNIEGMGFSAMVDGVYTALESEGIADGSVKIAAVDISSMTGQYFQNGVQVWTCGGQYATAMVAWAVLYNYLMDGTRIIPDPAQPLIRQYIEITSYEEYEQYVKYVEGVLPSYDADEIADMIHYLNPDVTYADYETEAHTYSLADIVARHAYYYDPQG